MNYISKLLFAGVRSDVGFFVGMELVGPSKRLFAGVINEVFFAIGLVLLAGVAYAFRDWFWIELSLSLPTIVFLSFWW